MLIREKPLRHWIDHFYGYGSWQAPIWFIGYEEPGGDLPEDVAERINYLYKQKASDDSLCDIRELYKQVTFRIEGPRAEAYSTLYDHRFGKHAVLHGIWKNLIAFAHACGKKKVPDLLTYQQKSFTQNEAMINLYPLPSPHNHAWYYSWLDIDEFKFLKSRPGYEEKVYPRRIEMIFGNIVKYRPKVVLMYDMSDINKLKNSVLEFFPGTKFKTVKATRLEIPQHHQADLGDTILVITTQTPALRHNRIETGFDWEKFGKLVTSGKA